ncbi:hypothetical protein PIB30_066840 [Stylosanthes scabra]|uniref:Uncharacterized protein n=1 Tax=Stylosanthes scabra TaxID=79078 RepID=A0ABU6RME2_9FABA|nr:hypothetical protein [Stylosanthes scabra]
MNTNGSALSRKNRKEIMNEKSKRPRICGSSACFHGETQPAAKTHNTNQPMLSKCLVEGVHHSATNNNERQELVATGRNQQQQCSHDINNFRSHEISNFSSQKSTITNFRLSGSPSGSKLLRTSHQKENTIVNIISPEANHHASLGVLLLGKGHHCPSLILTTSQMQQDIKVH